MPKGKEKQPKPPKPGKRRLWCRNLIMPPIKHSPYGVPTPNENYQPYPGSSGIHLFLFLAGSAAVLLMLLAWYLPVRKHAPGHCLTPGTVNRGR